MSTCAKCGGDLVPSGPTVCPACGSRVEPGGDNGLSIVAMILGCIALALCWVPFLGLVIGAVGVALAIPAANREQKLREWALGLSLLGALFGLMLTMAGL